MEDVTPKTYTYIGKQNGPHVVIFGCIHGDETCGFKAITKFINKVKSDKDLIHSGKLTLVPICNKQAWIKQKRYIDKNMNNSFQEDHDDGSYESRISKNLMGILKEADYLLDLHSNDADGPPFCFQDYDDEKTTYLAKATGVENIVKGWLEIPAHHNKGEPIPYIKKYKGTGVVVECGKNGTVESDKFAYEVIMNTLSNLSMIKGNKIKPANNTIAEVEKLYFKDKTQYAFSQSWINFDLVTKGTIIASTPDGDQIVAEHDSIILMPNSNPTHGLAYFYLAKKI